MLRLPERSRRRIVDAGPQHHTGSLGPLPTAGPTCRRTVEAYHLFCGPRNLAFMRDHPTGHCESSSRPWTDALANEVFDIVSVQPHFLLDLPTPMASDVDVVSQWIDLQPASTTWVIHTGWAPREDLVATFDGT